MENRTRFDATPKTKFLCFKVKSIRETGARVIPPTSGIRAMKVEAAAETPITPGMVEVHGNLTVIYEVR